MRDLYLNFGALMAAAWYAKKRRQQPPPGKNQVLQSRRMEDEVYRQNRPRSEALEEVRRTCEAKFPLIENLSRDRHCSFTSCSAILNDHRDHKFRIIYIRITNKPGMAVSLLIKLCRPCLAGNSIGPAIQRRSCT